MKYPGEANQYRQKEDSWLYWARGETKYGEQLIKGMKFLPVAMKMSWMIKVT